MPENLKRIRITIKKHHLDLAEQLRDSNICITKRDPMARAIGERFPFEDIEVFIAHVRVGNKNYRLSKRASDFIMKWTKCQNVMKCVPFTFHLTFWYVEEWRRSDGVYCKSRA